MDFVYDLSDDSHLDIYRVVWTAYSRSLLGDSVDLQSGD